MYTAFITITGKVKLKPIYLLSGSQSEPRVLFIQLHYVLNPQHYHWYADAHLPSPEGS